MTDQTICPVNPMGPPFLYPKHCDYRHSALSLIFASVLEIEFRSSYLSCKPFKG